MKIALYKTEDGGAQVISQGPDGEWMLSESISVADVMNSPHWIEDESSLF